MSVKFANNAFGTLNAGISNSATSLTLSSGQGARFPTLASGEYFYATLIDTSNNLEVVKCTARSTDVLTITRAQESTTAQAFAIGDRVELRVTAAGLTDAANPYDKDTSSTGSLALPVGTTAQQPTAADTEGHIRYDSDDNIVYYSDGTNWLKVSSTIPILSTVTGNLVVSNSTTLTLAGSGFLTANLVVTFTQSSDSIDEDVTVTPASDTSATVTVPAAVYNNVTSGNLVTVTVTNSDGVQSAGANITAKSLPSGGTVTTVSGKRVHTFTSSGTFTNTLSLTGVEYLVIAGGGTGGTNGGGGGAGGYRCSVAGENSGGGASAESTLSLSAGSFSVTVGAGGSGAGQYPAQGSAGSNSVFSTITSTGGGVGGSETHDNGNGTAVGGSGGSGGGGGYQNKSGGSGTSGQGYAGGSSTGGTDGRYGGGGGAGAVGESPASAKGGNGGNGVSSSINGTATTRGGGGGGGHQGAVQPGTGGTGGGGNGINNSSGSTAGSANTGGGGGGSSGGAGYSSNGGSGIVIIRYAIS